MGKAIYLITVLSNLDFFARLVFVVTAFIILVSIFALACALIDKKDEESNVYKSYIKKSVIIFSICATINILVPSKEDMYMIYATKYVTKENLQMTKDEVKNLIDYVFDKVKELNSEK